MPDERPIPLLGDVALTSVQRLEHLLDGGFAAQEVVGLPGQVQQHLGRGSHVVLVEGTLHGETYADDLAALQSAAADGAPLTFVADIITALQLKEVVIESFRVAEVAGETRQARYALVLREDPPLPPPADVASFGGLGAFGVGALGFDTDIMGSLAGLAGDIAGAVESALDATAALQALAGLGDLGFGGELQPLEEAVDRIGAAASGFRDAIGGLGRLFG
jgi:hypothetical protein